MTSFKSKNVHKIWNNDNTGQNSNFEIINVHLFNCMKPWVFQDKVLFGDPSMPGEDKLKGKCNLCHLQVS